LEGGALRAGYCHCFRQMNWIGAPESTPSARRQTVLAFGVWHQCRKPHV